MGHQRLFIANLSKGKIGHDKANLVGSPLVTQFQLAAMRHAGQPEFLVQRVLGGVVKYPLHRAVAAVGVAPAIARSDGTRPAADAG